MSRSMINNNYENLVSPSFIASSGMSVDTQSGNWNVYHDWMKNSKKVTKRR